jgi:hypothetical protein
MSDQTSNINLIKKNFEKKDYEGKTYYVHDNGPDYFKIIMACEELGIPFITLPRNLLVEIKVFESKILQQNDTSNNQVEADDEEIEIINVDSGDFDEEDDDFDDDQKDDGWLSLSKATPVNAGNKAIEPASSQPATSQQNSKDQTKENVAIIAEEMKKVDTKAVNSVDAPQNLKNVALNADKQGKISQSSRDTAIRSRELAAQEREGATKKREEAVLKQEQEIKKLEALILADRQYLKEIRSEIAKLQEFEQSQREVIIQNNDVIKKTKHDLNNIVMSI